MPTKSVAPQVRTISFSGFTWKARGSGRGDPGPNYWDQNNVSVDAQGHLHLKLTQQNHRWWCSEVYLQQRLGFGRYQFWIIAPIDALDRNIVFGLFNHPTPDVGKTGTNEIDIEFAKWGNLRAAIGNYTVWSATDRGTRETKGFSFCLSGTYTTHRFVWAPTSVAFQSLHGHRDDNRNEFARWRYRPQNPTLHISRKSMPVQMNLWCHRGRRPHDERPVEVVVRAFKFTPIR